MAPFLGGLFESKAVIAASRNKNAIPRATGASLSRTVGTGQSLGPVGRWDIDQAMQYGVDQIMLVFRCVDVIAQNQSGLNLRLRRGLDRTNGEWMDDKDIQRLLNFRTNSYETATQFRYRLSANLLLSRRGAFIEVIRDTEGVARELHLLPAGVTEPITDDKTFVRGYAVRRSDYVIDELNPDDVIWVKLKPHPQDPYQQMTALTSLGITIETDWLARQFNRMYLANGGRQGLLIALKGEVGQEDAEEIKRRFTGGPMRAGEATVIEADGIQVSDMSGKPADTQWDNLINLNKSEILLGFGVPESVMGNASGRTWDNADAERENFWNDTMVPHCTAIAQALDPLTGDTNDDVVIAYDFTTVDVLQRTARRDREEARAEFQAGLRTIDEYRTKFLGLEALNVPGTQVLFHTTGAVIGPDDETTEKAGKLPVLGTPPEPEGGEDGAGLGNPMNGGGDVSMSDSWNNRSLANDLLVKAAEMRSRDRRDARPKADEVFHPYLNDVVLDEKTLEGILIGWDSQQESIITDRLSHAKFRQGTRFWEYKDGQAPDEFKALDASYAVDPARWVADLKRSARRTLENTVLREARRIASEISAQNGPQAFLSMFPNDLDRGSMLNKVYDDAWNVIEGSANAQLERTMKRINTMADNGATLKDIEKEVRRSIGARSKWRQRVVQNAVHTATEGARFEVATASKSGMVKVWHSHHDDRTRASHVRADGQVRKAGSRFRVGPAWLMYPRDPSGPPAQTYNCRCWTEWRAHD